MDEVESQTYTMLGTGMPKLLELQLESQNIVVLLVLVLVLSGVQNPTWRSSSRNIARNKMLSTAFPGRPLTRSLGMLVVTVEWYTITSRHNLRVGKYWRDEHTFTHI